MRVPLEWLSEYCAPGLDADGVDERLTMTGTKVEAVRHHGVAAPDGFVVGRVLGVEPHPQADRLRVCAVDLGSATDGEAATIVCGAPNVAAGQAVAVALPGATMPDGSKLAAAKLRGVASEGMILAEDELEIGSDHEGVMVLDGLFADDRLTPGTALATLLSIGTPVLELEITPNRPDCLGIYGVARELHAATGAPLQAPPWSGDPGSVGPLQAGSVQVQCPDLCPRFTARAFEGVSVGPSPMWLKARLSAAGQRPINNVVDITNYVMLATGQPLHAFDLDLVAGERLSVRRALARERVTTLDGVERELDEQMVVIEDADGPTSIAGVMGGRRSEVRPETVRVLLEVATWNGPNIHRTSWRLGVRSEASARFEKGLAQEQCAEAQALATRLLIECCKARVLPGTLDIGDDPPAPTRILLRAERVHRILGIEIEPARQAEILEALGFATEPAQAGLTVTVPPHRRNDVTREADLIEEVARIDGLEKLSATLPRRRPAGRLTREQRLTRSGLDALVGRGLHEVVGWTFTSREALARLRLGERDARIERAVALENPLSEEHALLRPTLLSSLLEIGASNAARDIGDLRIFEAGTVFARDEGLPTSVREHRALGVLLSGRLWKATWREGEPPMADFHAIKAIAEALEATLRISLDYRPTGERHPFLRPGACAAVHLDGTEVGWVGELHPLVAGWELEHTAVLEVDLDALVAAAPPLAGYRDLTSYPALRNDLAVTLPRDVSAAQALAAVREAAGALLEDVEVFDVYAGPQVGEGRRSLALALAFRADDRTLTEHDIAPVRARVVAALGALGGELRG